MKGSKEDKAFWRAETNFTKQWESKVTWATLQNMIQAFATGWTKGSDWKRRNIKRR